ncbi:(R)-mandelonitrile lyase [Flavobacterium pectinovorum]|uniref:Cupin domain protein n=2 Tax=Flavobacterium pectinovorum TaxID=29533 RepID=A0ABY1IZZ9_9FLAO|nr:cupin domain-containing protein [Flavobacterium pectinovorum]SHL62258.1 Cupin domain protein [Flavobacterium pectinovorum]
MMNINFRKNITIASLSCIIMAALSCNGTKENHSDENVVFPKGKKVGNTNFTGTAWLTMLTENDTIYNTQIGNVTFEPGARTNWHYHKGGQILLVTQGKGYYQEKGKQIKIIKKGEVIKCPPNVMHWHGATPTDTLVHVAISTNTDNGTVVWLESVSDEEYSKYKND